MFKLKNKNLIRLVAVVLFLLLVSGLITISRPAFLNVLKFPLILTQLFAREAKGLFFYHRNFMVYAKQKEEIDLLKQRLNECDEISRENERLRRVVSFKEKQAYKTAAARVIARCPDSWSSCIMIDKGRSSGIGRGMAVITPEGLAGRVIEAAGSAAKAVLINDPNLNISAIVQRSRQEGLVSGTLGNNLIMRYLPDDADIQLQDVVLTSGLIRGFPKAQVIGTVVEINREFSGMGRYALIKPAVCLACIEEVLVVLQ